MRCLWVVYARSASLAGWAVRHRDPFGRWSHCGIQTTDGTVIEAHPRRGVVETDYDRFVTRYGERRVEQHGIECPDPDAGIAWARSQLGRGYDWLSVIGLGSRLAWNEIDRWQCAELVEAALAYAGRERFRYAPYRITPNMSWMTR